MKDFQKTQDLSWILKRESELAGGKERLQWIPCSYGCPAYNPLFLDTSVLARPTLSRQPLGFHLRAFSGFLEATGEISGNRPLQEGSLSQMTARIYTEVLQFPCSSGAVIQKLPEFSLTPAPTLGLSHSGWVVNLISNFFPLQFFFPLPASDSRDHLLNKWLHLNSCFRVCFWRDLN